MLHSNIGHGRPDIEPETTNLQNHDVSHGALVLETANRVALNILANQTGIEALEHIVEAARTLAGAQYAALGVASPDGDGLSDFITTGLSAKEESDIGDGPLGAGVLGLLLERSGPLRVDVLSEHPASTGFPSNHPPMTSFLGVPVLRGETPLGSLYLTNKTNGRPFTSADESAVQALASHAAVAIHHMGVLERKRSLVRGLMFVQEEERRSIACDLHDGLTQYVMSAYAHFESHMDALEVGATERAGRELEKGMAHLHRAVIESRQMVSGLRSLSLDDLGLIGAVEQLLSEERDLANWGEAKLIQNIGATRFDRVLETAVYRVVQEALTNVRKHAAADTVHITLRGTDNNAGLPHLLVEVRDWGCGFTTVPVAREHSRFGLHGMIERVHMLDGEHTLWSEPGEGTIVRVRFPITGARVQSRAGGAN